MARLVLHICMIFTLAICSLHSPSMLHVQNPDHAHHVDAASSGHHEQVGTPAHDVDRGTLAHDHHVPTGMPVALPRMDTPLEFAASIYRLSNSAALGSWSTAPPPEPPAA